LLATKSGLSNPVPSRGFSALEIIFLFFGARNNFVKALISSSAGLVF